jgi:glutamyl-tRNA reductase
MSIIDKVKALISKVIAFFKKAEKAVESTPIVQKIEKEVETAVKKTVKKAPKKTTKTKE